MLQPDLMTVWSEFEPTCASWVPMISKVVVDACDLGQDQNNLKN